MNKANLRAAVWATGFMHGIARAFDDKDVGPAAVLPAGREWARRAVYYFDQLSNVDLARDGAPITAEE